MVEITTIIWLNLNFFQKKVTFVSDYGLLSGCFWERWNWDQCQTTQAVWCKDISYLLTRMILYGSCWIFCSHTKVKYILNCTSLVAIRRWQESMATILSSVTVVRKGKMLIKEGFTHTQTFFLSLFLLLTLLLINICRNPIPTEKYVAVFCVEVTCL